MNEMYTSLNSASTAMARSYLESSSGQPWGFSWVSCANMSLPIISKTYAGDTLAFQPHRLPTHTTSKDPCSSLSCGEDGPLISQEAVPLVLPPTRATIKVCFRLDFEFTPADTPQGSGGRRSSPAWNWHLHLSGNPVTGCRALEIGEWLVKS